MISCSSCMYSWVTLEFMFLLSFRSSFISFTKLPSTSTTSWSVSISRRCLFSTSLTSAISIRVTLSLSGSALVVLAQIGPDDRHTLVSRGLRPVLFIEGKSKWRQGLTTWTCDSLLGYEEGIGALSGLGVDWGSFRPVERSFFGPAGLSGAPTVTQLPDGKTEQSTQAPH